MMLAKYLFIAIALLAVAAMFLKIRLI